MAIPLRILAVAQAVRYHKSTLAVSARPCMSRLCLYCSWRSRVFGFHSSKTNASSISWRRFARPTFDRVEMRLSVVVESNAKIDFSSLQCLAFYRAIPRICTVSSAATHWDRLHLDGIVSVS